MFLSAEFAWKKIWMKSSKKREYVWTGREKKDNKRDRRRKKKKERDEEREEERKNKIEEITERDEGEKSC